MKGGPFLLRCNCDHKYQDETYGKNVRLHNGCKPQSGKYTQARCTVCESTKSVTVREEKRKK